MNAPPKRRRGRPIKADPGTNFGPPSSGRIHEPDTPLHISQVISEQALKYAMAGIPVFPCKLDKSPATAHGFKDASTDEEKIKKWFFEDDRLIGIPTGEIVCLDVEDDPTAQAVEPALASAGLPALVAQKTISGGRHFLFRTDTQIKNMKLARADSGGKDGLLIETRGQGGYICTGGPYQWLNGDLTDVPLLSTEQTEDVLSIARSFDQLPKEKKNHLKGDDQTPGDDYNQRGDWRGLVRSYGWREAGGTYWRRPGKERGISANWIDAANLLHVFTSNGGPLEGGESYKPFALFAMLEHGGDFSAAARDLAQQGYGKPMRLTPGQPPQSLDQDSVPKLAKASAKDYVQHRQLLNFAVDCARSDEAGLADLFANGHGDHWRFDKASKQWMHFDGKRWIDDAKERHRPFLRDFARTVFKEARIALDKIVAQKVEEQRLTPEDAKKLPEAVQSNHVFRAFCSLNKVRTLNNALTLAADLLAVTTPEFDSKRDLLNLQNGCLSLETGELRPHDPNTLCRKMAYADWDTEATCPNWIEFIKTVFCQDEDMVAYAQKLLGTCISGRVDWDFVAFTIGGGSNGKSTLFDIIKHVLGDYSTSISVELILAQGGNRDNATDAEKCQLQGSRLAVASEIPGGRKLNDSLVKDLTGGDAITARQLYGTPFTFEPTSKLFIFGNSPPRIDASDGGIWRRIKILPFRHRFPAPGEAGNRSRGDVLAELKAESAGILQWLHQGYRLAVSDGIEPPHAAAEALRQLRDDSDPFAAFIESKCEVAPHFSALRPELYRALKDYCEGEKKRTPTDAEKRMLLENMGCTLKKTGGQWFIEGLRLKQ